MLDNLPITQPAFLPSTIPNVQAYIAPPVIGDMLAAPQVYIWSGKITDKRQTMAGARTATIGTTSGFRIATYEMGIFIKYMMPNDLALEDNIFPLIVDSIMIKLRSTTLPMPLTDATIGSGLWPSTITHFGEDMDVWYGNIHAAEDGRFWVYEAEIRCTIREAYQQ